MNWITLKSAEQLQEIRQASELQPVLIFKHSTRCSTSRMVLDRLERNWNGGEMSGITPYFLDLLSFRAVSNLIAEIFNVEHESPQVLLIRNGQSVLDLSHFEIEYDQIKSAVKTQTQPSA
jgi:bacillithiol system protein YtxJ